MTRAGGTLVIGATPQGLQAALTLAHSGRRVSLCDPAAELHRPDRRWSERSRRRYRQLLIQVRYHFLIEVCTATEVTKLTVRGEGVTAGMVRRPLWVDPGACVDCGRCLDVCPVELADGRRPLFRLAVPEVAAIDKRQTAPCRDACPLGMNVQGYVALVGRGRFADADELIRQTNPLPGICGRVCHHPCEAACRRQEIDEPIAICSLKRFVADQSQETAAAVVDPTPHRPGGPRVAIVGSGPAGLTAAHDLARAGLRPTIVEADARPGGLLVQGIAPYRLPREVVTREIDRILSLGVELRLNSPVRSRQDLERLRTEGFRAIVLATGASRDMNLNIAGEHLQGICGCVAFLNRLWNGRAFGDLGRVAVVGGGNAAVEAARAAVRGGARGVLLLYRRTRREMPADRHEIEQALEEGVLLMPLTQPVAFEGAHEHLARIRCVRMRLAEVDASGRPRPVPIRGSAFDLAADTAIVSIGQQANLSYASGEMRIMNRRGTIALESAGGTAIQGLYAAGDVVSGPSMVVDAMASGRRAARTVIADLMPGGRSAGDGAVEVERKEHLRFPRSIARRARLQPPHRPVDERTRDRREVIGAFTADQAVQEAGRCLQCGFCSECGCCEAACELGAIRHERGAEARSRCFESVVAAGAEPHLPAGHGGRIIKTPLAKGSTSLAKAEIAGRAAAFQAMACTMPISIRLAPEPLAGRQPARTGVFICSCNGTLNPDGRLEEIADRIGRIADIVHVQVVRSACHPELGRCIETALDEKGCNSALVASCVCCHLDFACEACNEQRMRLKQRLFGQKGYDRQDVALVNIKDTCLQPFEGQPREAVRRAVNAIQAGLWQLKEHYMRQPPARPPFAKAVVLGLSEAGFAAACSLKKGPAEVVAIEDGPISRSLRGQLADGGIGVMTPLRVLRIDGRSGDFRVWLEDRAPLRQRSEGARKRPSARFDPSAAGGDPRCRSVSAGMVILGRSKFARLPYHRDPFGPPTAVRMPKGHGTLETGIAGIYRAAWPGQGDMPTGVVAAAVADRAFEGLRGESGCSNGLCARVDPELCRGCGRCAEICPEGAVELEEIGRGVTAAWVEAGRCCGCGNCLAECPTGAIRMPESEQVYFERMMHVHLP